MKKINDEALLNRIGFKPHEGQAPIIEAIKNKEIRDFVLVCGRRFGKTFIAAYVAFRELLKPNRNIWIVAPTSDLTQKTFTYILQFLSKIFEVGDYSIKTKPYTKLTMANGSWIECKTADNPTCFDKETEILTREGWKYFEKLNKDDVVLVRDNGISKWQGIKRIVKENYSGEMFEIKSKSLDLLITPNHRMLVKKRYSQEEKIVLPKDLKHNDVIPANSRWIGDDREYFTLPSICKNFGNYEKYCEPILIKMNLWCAFLGIFLAEGSCAGSKGGMTQINSGNYITFISQKKGDNRRMIKELLDELPFNYCECREGFSIGNKQLWNYMKQFKDSYNKFIPNEIKDLSIDNLKILVDWMILGDGCTHKGQRSYYTTSKRLANDFQEVLQKIGRYGIIRKRKPTTAIIKGRIIKSIADMFEVSEKTREYHSLCSSKRSYISKVYYNGKIYCCETDAGIVYVRRNGKPCWSGNSLIGEELDLLIIDEAARIPPMTYERELAATTMSRKGRTIFISSPKGKNWFYEKYKEVERNEDGFVWNAPSSVNPNNTPEELERIKKGLPDAIWKQEYLAQFTDSGAEVFRNILDVTLDKDLCYEEPSPTHRYVMGVDIAKLNDWTVLTVVDKQSHKVVAWDRFQKVDYPIQNSRISTLAKKYNNARVILDATGGGKVLEDFLTREDGLVIDAFNFGRDSKINLIDKLGQYIENKSIFIPNEKALIDELEVFGLDVMDNGRLKYGAPIGFNDDCVCSLALAVWGLSSTKLKREASPYKQEVKEAKKIERIKKRKVHI